MKKNIIIAFIFMILALSIVYADSAPTIKSFTGKKIREDLFQLTWEINDDINLSKYELYKDNNLLHEDDITGVHFIDIYQNSELHPENHTYLLVAYDIMNNTANATLSFVMDNKAPQIIENSPLVSNDTILRITTDENATCKYYDTEDENATLSLMSGKINHTSTLNISEGEYNFYVICFDENLNKANKTIDFIYTKISFLGILNFNIKAEPSKAVLSWNSSGNSAGINYNIYKSTSLNAGYSLIASTNSLNYTDSANLREGIVYYYYIEANSAKSEAKSVIISSSNVNLAITSSRNPILMKNEYVLTGTAENDSLIMVSVSNPYNEKIFTTLNSTAVDGAFRIDVPISAEEVIIEIEVFNAYNNSNKEKITVKLYQQPVINATEDSKKINITKESSETDYKPLIITLFLLIAFSIVVWQIYGFKRKKSDQFELHPYLKKRHRIFRK